MALLDRLQQLEARAPGHADVGDQHLGRAAGERVERFLRRGERVVRDALAAERFLDHPADGAVVVDDPDRFHVSGSRILNMVRPGRRLELDDAVVVVHERLREREPQTGAAFPARDERIEDPVLDLLRHARAVVDDLQF